MAVGFFFGLATGVFGTLLLVWLCLRDLEWRRLPPRALTPVGELPDALPLQLARARSLRLVARDGSLVVPAGRVDFEPPEGA